MTRVSFCQKCGTLLTTKSYFLTKTQPRTKYELKQKLSCYKKTVKKMGVDMDFKDIIEKVGQKTTTVIKHWKSDKFSSKKIKAEIENVFFVCDANIIEKLAYFDALNSRIEIRYNNFFKKMFRYFSWKSDTLLLKKIKKHLNISENQDIMEVVSQKCDNETCGKDLTKSDKTDTTKSGVKKDLSLKNLDNGKIKNSLEIKPTEATNEKVADSRVEQNNQDCIVEQNTVEKIVTNDIKNSFEPTFNDVVLDNVDKNTEIKNMETMLSNNSTREKIEIPKEDLINYNKTPFANARKISSPNMTANKELVGVKIETGLSGNNDLIKNNEQDKLLDDKTLKSDVKQKVDTIPYDKLEKNEVNINYQDKVESFKKTDNVNTYYDKTEKVSAVAGRNLYEQQKNEILKDEIAKISEKDMQVIKDFMQAELDRQMRIAEEKGEVYKMPLGIKEALEHSEVERSKAQSNKLETANLNNNKVDRL